MQTLDAIHPRTRNLVAPSARQTVITVTLGETLIQLGLAPVTAVLPAVAAAVGVGPVDGAWIITAYILALAGTLLVSGRLGDLVGHATMFRAGAVMFAIATAAAGFVSTFELLVLARTAQGVGGAMISGNNLAILTHTVASTDRGKAIALVATVSALAAVIGSGVGTLAVSAGGWRWLFLGVAPLAVWAAVRARRLPGRERMQSQVDWWGAALLALTISLVAVALNHPHTNTDDLLMPVYHWWLPLLAVAAGTAFIVVEQRVQVPLMDWGQLRRPLFAASITVNAVLHMTMMGAMFLGPVLAVRGLGLDSTAGGLLMVFVQASVVLTSLAGGWLFDRTGALWIRPAAAVLLGLGLTMWALAGVTQSYLNLVIAGIVAGLGSGALLAVNNAVIMVSLPGQFRGVASGMLETTRHFGHAFGVTIPTAILAIVAAASVGTESQALMDGFFWACLVMAALAFLGAGLAAVWRSDTRVHS
ncbi:MAG: MFS transporter [Chloroflexota bacterium]